MLEPNQWSLKPFCCLLSTNCLESHWAPLNFCQSSSRIFFCHFTSKNSLPSFPTCHQKFSRRQRPRRPWPPPRPRTRRRSGRRERSVSRQTTWHSSMRRRSKGSRRKSQKWKWSRCQQYQSAWRLTVPLLAGHAACCARRVLSAKFTTARLRVSGLAPPTSKNNCNV